MENSREKGRRSRHLRITEPSPWVRRFAPLVPRGGVVLDVAAGGGRHSRHFLVLGYGVVAIDRTAEPLTDLLAHPRAQVIEADLEDGSWPLGDRTFAGVVVTNYLYRPLFPRLLDALEAGGVLIYETFARGNERFSRPRSPDHLLRGGELLSMIDGRLQVVAYEHGIVERTPIPGVVQRICAVNDLGASPRANGEPEAHPVDGG